MRKWLMLLPIVLLTACATPAKLPPPSLFNDALFEPPSTHVNAQDVFAVNQPMRDYLSTAIVGQLHGKGYKQTLFDALYKKDGLRLEYDAVMTRNASEAFSARSGNCLSLVIMTAAFAKELNLEIQYQRVDTEEIWSRNGGLYFSSGHVNLVLGKRRFDIDHSYDSNRLMTIDFLPPEEILGQRVVSIDENTIVAMYMNNRAAEALTLGKLDDAYWWAREAVIQDQKFLPGYNTLAVIYRQTKHLTEAEQVLTHAIQLDPQNLVVMSNLIQVWKLVGKDAQANMLSQTLEKLQNYPPFYYFERGISAIKKGDFRAARDFFIEEIKHAPDYHESHFWLAIAYLKLGENKLATEQLAIAKENSTTHSDYALYSAKLDHINAVNQRFVH